MRDPLVGVYQAIQSAIQNVHGANFVIRDGDPNPLEFKKEIPAAHIYCISGVPEKALMREYEPHGILDNGDGTFTVGTESVRFEYLIQVSFYASTSGIAQQLLTEFIAYVEKDNEIPIPNDKWGEIMQIFLSSAPSPPRGEPDLYQTDATYQCRGKLILEEVVNALDVTNYHPKLIE